MNSLVDLFFRFCYSIDKPANKIADKINEKFRSSNLVVVRISSLLLPATGRQFSLKFLFKLCID